MSTITSETKSSPFPPNVVAYIRQELERRTEYKKELESIPKFYGYDEFTKMRHQEQVDSMQYNIDRITNAIIAIVKKWMPSIEIDANQEVTVSNILAALPPPEETVIKKVYHSDMP